MANFHLEVSIVSRGKGRSFTKLANYISGERLYDSYEDRTYYRRREDVLYFKIFQPSQAPERFYDLQNLCDAVEMAEKRYDSRTAREIKASLPNELPLAELEQIVSEYVERNFTSYNLCVLVAVHEGNNELNPQHNNPHAHIILPMREVSSDGFAPKKNRQWNHKRYIRIWREDWAGTVNRAYERAKLPLRVDAASLEVQGEYDREPTIHLSRIDWQKEKKGERTVAGDRKREIKARNEELERERKLQLERRCSHELSR